MGLEMLPEIVKKQCQQILRENGFCSEGKFTIEKADKCVLSSNFYVSIKNVTDDRKMYLFIKCLIQSECHYAHEAQQFFNNELILYGDVLSCFLKQEKERMKYITSHVTCIPKCLSVGKHDEPFIIIENLKEQGYVPLNLREPLSLKCIQTVLKQLGRFHAYSFAMKNQHPELFAQATGKLRETAFYENVSPTYRKLFIHAIHDAFKLAQQNFPKDSLYVRKLSLFVLDIFNKMIFLAKGDDEDKQYFVVTHGDLWPNNMLYKISIDKREHTGNIVFVDFQGCRCSSPAQDLILVLLVSIDQSTRERHREDLIRTYHAALCETLEQFGSDPLRLFPYLALQSQIRKHARFALAMALAGLPLYLDEGPRPLDLQVKIEPKGDSQETLDVSIQHVQARKSIKCKNKMLEILMDVVNQGWL